MYVLKEHTEQLVMTTLWSTYDVDHSVVYMGRNVFITNFDGDVSIKWLYVWLF